MIVGKVLIGIQLGDTTEFNEVPTLGGGPGALASGLTNGQTAVIPNGPKVYVLAESDAVVDDDNVIGTMDDSTRRWLKVAPYPVT